MNIIADTNIFLAVVLNEPEKERIVRLTAEVDAVSPEILPYEIGNALTAMVKRGQLSKNETLSVFDMTRKIPVRLVSTDIHSALKIAIEFNIYAFDAYFLQCAKTMSCPLLTLDKRMKQVAKELNITLVG